MRRRSSSGNALQVAMVSATFIPAHGMQMGAPCNPLLSSHPKREYLEWVGVNKVWALHVLCVGDGVHVIALY
jgi:hypothetical protein